MGALADKFMIDDGSIKDQDSKEAFITVILNNIELVVENSKNSANYEDTYSSCIQQTLIDRMDKFDSSLKE